MWKTLETASPSSGEQSNVLGSALQLSGRRPLLLPGCPPAPAPLPSALCSPHRRPSPGHGVAVGAPKVLSTAPKSLEALEVMGLDVGEKQNRHLTHACTRAHAHRVWLLSGSCCVATGLSQLPVPSACCLNSHSPWGPRLPAWPGWPVSGPSTTLLPAISSVLPRLVLESEHRGRSEVDAGGGGGGARHVAGEVFLLGVHPDLSFLGGPLPGEGRAVRASPHSLSHCEM